MAFLPTSIPSALLAPADRGGKVRFWLNPRGNLLPSKAVDRDVLFMSPLQYIRSLGCGIQSLWRYVGAESKGNVGERERERESSRDSKPYERWETSIQPVSFFFYLSVIKILHRYEGRFLM